jgi:hypothetical protein
MDGQPAWRFCDKCFGMFFNGDPDPNRKGSCPAGGGHQAQGFVFYLPHDVPDTVGQPDWRFCDKCFGMFFNGDPNPNTKGRCPAGGGHEAQGFAFVLPHDVPDTTGQPAWRFCDKCFGMFYNGDPDPNRKGRCPGGGEHEPQGAFLFVLPHRGFPSPSVTISPIADDGLFLAVEGSAFEPSQPAQISYQMKFTTGDFTTGGPLKVTIDSAGILSSRIPTVDDLSSAAVSVFDFGSGQTATATLG